MSTPNIGEMDYAELKELVGSETAQALKSKHEADMGVPSVNIDEYSDEEYSAILDQRPDIEVDESDDPFYFTKLLNDEEYSRTMTEEEFEIIQRWSDIEALRDHYEDFREFLYDCMNELMGFNCSPLQLDIAEFLQSDTQYGMIQAQRSQAKSTIAAMFAVWQLIHDCKHRILIVSAGSDVANEIAKWIIQIIMDWDILACMRPDRQRGDRASAKAFDVHWQLKGAEKSPSVACIGITANMQGRRADLLLADDIESSKNGITETQRSALEHLSKDFSSICQKGRIIYLGTPQTVDSIYKNLPSRGFTVRVWTGRVPTDEEAKHYGDTLAPYIRDMMIPKNQIGYGVDGSRGIASDPMIVSDEMLIKKELDQGASYFNLQFMLNTELSDLNRHPLKTRDLIVCPFDIDKAFGEYTWMPDRQKEITVEGFNCKPQFFKPYHTSTELFEYEGKHMYVDTAGGGKNGDETVATVTYFLHGYIFWAETLKLAGGYSDSNYIALAKLAMKHRVNSIDVEKNFGNGAFAAAWRPVLAREYKKAGLEYAPRIEDVWETGQKELRIIDTLEPIMGRHRLIVHEDILNYDLESTQHHPIDVRSSYQVFHQLSKITRDKGALLHDDCIDSLAGACRKWVNVIATDEKIRIEQKTTDDNLKWIESMRNGDHDTGFNMYARKPVARRDRMGGAIGRRTRR